MKRSSGFTLIELLVVISIIAILASLAIPAVTGALARGQMAQTLSNMKQLHLATFNMDLDNQQAGQPSGWPGTNTGAPANALAWAAALTNGNYLKATELQKLLSAQTLQATNTTSTNGWAIIVYDASSDDNGIVFLSTKNVAFAAGATNATAPGPTAASKPYGDKGFVLFRKGGDGQILQARFYTNNLSTTNQGAPL
ncbi:MAG: type II secretion system protein [Verrucomicrobiota bacterium]